MSRMMVTPTSGKLWALGGSRFSAVVGHRADRSHAGEEPKLSANPSATGRIRTSACTSWRKGRLTDEIPRLPTGPGNSAVRPYRGASENVVMAELRTHLATERVRVVTLRLKQTRPSPTIDLHGEARCRKLGDLSVGRIRPLRLSLCGIRA